MSSAGGWWRVSAAEPGLRLEQVPVIRRLAADHTAETAFLVISESGAAHRGSGGGDGRAVGRWAPVHTASATGATLGEDRSLACRHRVQQRRLLWRASKRWRVMTRSGRPMVQSTGLAWDWRTRWIRAGWPKITSQSILDRLTRVIACSFPAATPSDPGTAIQVERPQ